MNFKDFQSFIKKEDLRLRKKFNNPDEEKRLLSRVVKLSEESGEFASEVMLSMGDARDEKLSKFNKNNLEDEYADVVIVASMIAETLGIDMEKAIQDKIKKVEQRYKKS